MKKQDRSDEPYRAFYCRWLHQHGWFNNGTDSAATRIRIAIA